MKGQFDLKLMNAGGFGDDYFEAAIREKRLQEVLDGLELERHLRCNNVLFHWVVAQMYHNVMQHGLANGPWPTYDSNAWLNGVGLSTRDYEPAYDTVEQQYYGTIHNFSSAAAGGTSGKGMTLGIADSTIFEKNPDGKEEIYQRFRFLWLPSQGNSNDIRSLMVTGCQYSNQTGNEDRYTSGRVRLKDPDTGLPVVIVKNLNQVLIIEYTIFWVTL